MTGRVLTYQDLFIFLKAYGLGMFEVAAVVVLLSLRPRVPQIRAYLRWLAETKYFSVPAAVIIVALGVCFGPHSTEKIIRHIGLFLQVAGTATAIWGIIKTRKDWKLSPLQEKVKQWVERRPGRPRSGRFEVVGAALGIAGGAANVRGIYGVGLNPTIESVVESLIKDVENLHNRIDAAQAETIQKFNDVNQNIKNHEQARKEETAKIRQELLESATGGLHISAIGATLLIVGIVLGTASPEIQELVCAIYR